MASTTGGEPTPADRLESLLARYVEQRLAGGAPPEAADLCREEPELAGPLQTLINEYEAARRHLARFLDRAPAATAEDEASEEEIGPYLLLERLGEGGMGVVYRAVQREPIRRHVALKLIKPGMDSEQVLARFESERQALALMSHPGIAQVYEAGVTERGRPYFVMELVDGEPITDYCDRLRLSTDERLTLFIEVCEAVHHAHQNGIIHRDLKPSNVLVITAGGKAQPKVIDFGLAKALHQRLTERTALTSYGVVLGTPEYMSPEQADLSGLTVDTTTDIYSLGVLLYEILTGALPLDPGRLREAGLVEMQRILRDEEPVRPSLRLSSLGEVASSVAIRQRSAVRSLVRRLRGDLDWITLKALEKDRARRYQAANELAADVRRHLAHEPVIAGPPDIAYRIAKFVRRHRRLALSGAAILVTLAVGLVATVAQARRVERERQQRTAQLVDVSVDNGMARAVEGELFDALPWLVQALRLEEGGEEREHVHRVRIAAVLGRAPRLVQLWAHEVPVNCGELSPDGQRAVTGRADGETRVFDVETGRELYGVRHDGPVWESRFSAGGRWLVTCSDDSTAGVWDAKTGQLGARLLHADAVKMCRLSPDERHLATYSGAGVVSVWQVDGGRLLWQRTLQAEVAELKFDPDGVLLGVAERGDFSNTQFATRLFHVDSGAPATPPLQHVAGVRDLAFSPDGKLVATVGDDWWLRLWQIESGELDGNGIWLNQTVSSVSFSHDGEQLLTSGADGSVRRFTVATQEPLDSPLHESHPVLWAAFAPEAPRVLVLTGAGARLFEAGSETWRPLTPTFRDQPGSPTCYPSFDRQGARLLTIDTDDVVRVWSLTPSWPTRPRLRSAVLDWAHHWQIAQVAGERIASAYGFHLGSDRGYGLVWDAASGELVTPPLRHPSRVAAVALSPDGERVATGADDGSVRVWEVESGEPLTDLLEHQEQIQARRLRFSPDGRRLAVAASGPSSNGSAKMWDVESGRLLAEQAESPATAIRFTPGSDLVASGHADGKVLLWRPESGELVVPPLDHGAAVTELAFSQDGATLVTATVEGRIHFWSATTGEEVRAPIFQPAEPTLALSPDGCRVAVASYGGACRIYAVDTGLPVSPTLDHAGFAQVEFSPDGRWLLTSDGGSLVRVWDATSGQLVTPPLWNPGKWLYHSIFLPDARRFAVAATVGVFLWELRRIDWPLEDLELLDEVLPGERLPPRSASQPVRALPVGPAAAWSRLRSSHRESFGIDESSVLAQRRYPTDFLLMSAVVDSDRQMWERAIASLDPIVASPGATSTDLADRAWAKAELGRWDEARQDLVAACRLRPNATELESRLALVDLQLGHRTAHRDRCHRLLRRFGGTRNPDRGRDLIRACTLTTEAVAGFEKEMATLSVAVREGFGPAAWLWIALAQLRAGAPEEALAGLERRSEARNGADRMSKALEALAQAELGRRDRASEALAAAAALPASSARWTFRTVEQVLMTEAEAQIR